MQPRILETLLSRAKGDRLRCARCPGIVRLTSTRSLQCCASGKHRAVQRPDSGYDRRVERARVLFECIVRLSGVFGCRNPAQAADTLIHRDRHLRHFSLSRTQTGTAGKATCVGNLGWRKNDAPRTPTAQFQVHMRQPSVARLKRCDNEISHAHLGATTFYSA